jgi:hypothetical protein
METAAHILATASALVGITLFIIEAFGKRFADRPSRERGAFAAALLALAVVFGVASSVSDHGKPERAREAAPSSRVSKPVVDQTAAAAPQTVTAAFEQKSPRVEPAPAVEREGDVVTILNEAGVREQSIEHVLTNRVRSATGKLRKTTETDETLAGLITVRLYLDLSFVTNRQHALRLSAVGAGFDTPAAEQQAYNNLTRSLDDVLRGHEK